MSKKTLKEVAQIQEFCLARDPKILRKLSAKTAEAFVIESFNAVTEKQGDQELAWMVLDFFSHPPASAEACLRQRVKSGGGESKRGSGSKSRQSLTIVSWNVNSLRSRIFDKETAKCKRKPRTILANSPLGLLIAQVHPDIICFQETKCTAKTRDCLVPEGFYIFWNCATKQISWDKSGKRKIKDSNGYSGVAIWSREEPTEVVDTLPTLKEESKYLQDEGRILTAFFDKLAVVTTYTPNTLRAGTQRKDGSYPNPELIRHRENWDEAMGRYLASLDAKGFDVVWCGDLNTARGLKDIYWGELSREKLKQFADVEVTDDGEVVIIERGGVPLAPGDRKIAEKFASRYQSGIYDYLEGGGAGFRLEERRGLEKILSKGFRDVFRELHPEDYGFTYWDLIRPAFRGVNYGLRIDYFVVNNALLNRVKSMEVLPDVGVNEEEGKVPSDHAPIVLRLSL